MSRKRMFIWGVILIACGLVALYRSNVYWTPSPPIAPRVVFVTGGSGPYWQIAAAGAVAAAEEYDVELIVEMPETEESIAQQTQILIQQDYDEVHGLAVSPLDAEGQTHQINRISDKVPLVTFDSDAPLSERRCYVGTSNFGAGETSAALVREAVPEGGEVAVLQASLSKYNNIERKQGFEDTINVGSSGESEERYSVVGYLVDEGDSGRCAQNIREVLRDHPDLKCFVGMNAHHGPILVDVLKEEGKLGDIALVVFDAFAETLDGIAAGHIYATVAQDPYQYGYEAVKTLKELISAHDSLGVLGHGTINFQAEPVRQHNLEDFRQRLEDQRQILKTDATDDESASNGPPNSSFDFADSRRMML